MQVQMLLWRGHWHRGRWHQGCWHLPLRPGSSGVPTQPPHSPHMAPARPESGNLALFWSLLLFGGLHQNSLQKER